MGSEEEYTGRREKRMRQRKRKGERLSFGMTTKAVSITERAGGEAAVFLAMAAANHTALVPRTTGHALDLRSHA